MTRDIDHDIRPGIGIGSIVLGSSQADVRALLGEPEASEDVDYGDGVNTRNWEFNRIDISMSFSQDNDYRLGAVTTSSQHATLNGCAIVGRTEAELLAGDFGGIGPPTLEDDFEESGKDFTWPELNISCWTRDGVVDSVTVMPNYDETGNIPLWPAAEA